MTIESRDRILSVSIVPITAEQDIFSPRCDENGIEHLRTSKNTDRRPMPLLFPDILVTLEIKYNRSL